MLGAQLQEQFACTPHLTPCGLGAIPLGHSKEVFKGLGVRLEGAHAAHSEEVPHS